MSIMTKEKLGCTDAPIHIAEVRPTGTSARKSKAMRIADIRIFVA